MINTVSHPSRSRRFRRDRPIRERLAAAQPGFTIPDHLEKLAKSAKSSSEN